MRRPDFFIVGAPKCGTTSLHLYLRQHPEIFMPARKEFNYFGRDLTYSNTTGLWDFPTPESYLAYFSDWTDEKRGGEASVWYLYSRTAAREIKEFSPGARIIVMLRNPVDVMYSLFYQLLKTGDETIPDFETALRAEPERRRCPRPPHDRMNCPVEALWYTQVVQFTSQLRRYLEVFGRDRVLVVFYDDFARDTAGTYRQVLVFLGVDPSFRPDFQVANASEVLRSTTLWKVRYSSPAWMKALWRRWVPEPVRRRTIQGLWSLNVKKAKRPPMNPATRRRLLDLLAPEIHGLSRLLGRDLSHWLA